MNRTRLGSIRTFGRLLALGGLALLTGTGMTASEVLDQWYWRNPYPTGNDLYGVAYGKGRFVAVGYGGTILTSTDGRVWEHCSSGTDKQLNQVIFAQDMFLAIGEAGVILSSPDGLNWVSHSTNPQHSLSGVTFAQGKYVIVGATGPGFSQLILCSEDLVQWTSGQSPTTPSLSQVAYGNGMFMAIGGATTLVSSNGLDWNKVMRDSNLEAKCITFGNGNFVVAGEGGGILTTADGTEWLDRSIGGVIPFLGVSWVGNQFLMVGGRGRQPILLSLADGFSWAELDSTAADWLYALAHGDGRYVAVGREGQIVSSQDASTWSNETAFLFGHPFRGWLSAVAFGNGRFVAVGTEWIVTSTDGKAWATAGTPSPGMLNDVIFDGERFVAVGVHGNILWSNNGISWESTAVAPQTRLNNVAYGNGIYLVNGASGLNLNDDDAWLLRSTNLTEWETVYHSTNIFPGRIAYGNGRFVAGAPWNLVALVSTNGREWTEVSTGSVGITDMVFVDDKFVAIEGQSTNGLNWTFNSPEDRRFANENRLSHIAFADGVFIALDWDGGFVNPGLAGLGPLGSIWTSANGVQWTKRIDSTLRLIGVAYGNKTFVVVGGQTGIVQSANLASLVPISLTGTLGTAQVLNLSVTSVAGLDLTVETSSDLRTWQTLKTLVNVSGQTNFLESVSATSGQRFYRAKTSN